MYNDLFTVIGIILVAFIIIHVIIKLFVLQNNVIEGLTNPDETTATPPSSGIGATSKSYAASIKAEVVKMQDELLISKYRQDYETAIVNMDDWIGMEMIKHALTINIAGDAKSKMEALNSLNTLQSAKASLTATMKFLDSQ